MWCGSGARWRKSAGQYTCQMKKSRVWWKHNAVCMVHVIEQRQANWIGHVLRHDCLLKTVLEGKLEGKRTWWKPRRKKLNLLMEQEQEDKKISYQELKTRAEDRIQWHHHQLNWTCLRAEHTRRSAACLYTCWLLRRRRTGAPTAARDRPSDGACVVPAPPTDSRSNDRRLGAI